MGLEHEASRHDDAERIDEPCLGMWTGEIDVALSTEL